MLGIVPLLLDATIGVSRIAHAEEIEQKSQETIDEIISETVEQESSEPIDEIVVYGDKPLGALRREVYRAEENFFDLFSALNQDDDYDIRCYYEVPSFTHIRRHVCRAKFVIDATSAESAPAFSEQVGAFSRPAAYVIRMKKERLRELMEALVAERPELLQALNDYTNAKQILESEKEKR
jgi:hypothetical protein